MLNQIIRPPLPEGGRCDFCMDATYGANWQWSDGTFWARFDYLYDCRCTFAWRSRGWGDEVELQTKVRENFTITEKAPTSLLLGESAFTLTPLPPMNLPLIM